MVCGCASVHPTAAPSPATDSQKIALRNNAVSLLYDLLGDEKNVSKVLFIKHNNEELGRLIKSVSAASKDAAKQLTELAKTDPTLDLKTMQLPVGEVAARKAIAKTKEHELLSSSGGNFQFQLLLTQTDALSYGWHLADVAAENTVAPAEMRIFKEIGITYKDLYEQTIVLMKSPPLNN